MAIEDDTLYGLTGSQVKDLVNKVKTTDNSMELTQSEYDALTPEEQNNGTVYYITDGQSVSAHRVYAAESDGNAYIDTGLVMNYAYKFEVEGYTSHNNSTALVGAYVSNSERTTARLLPTSNKVQAMWPANKEITGATSGIDVTQMLKYTQDSTGITLEQGDTTYRYDYTGTTAGTSTANIQLFGETPTTYKTGAIIREVKIYDENGDLIRHYQPYSENGTIKMKELVSDTMITPIGGNLTEISTSDAKGKIMKSGVDYTGEASTVVHDTLYDSSGNLFTEGSVSATAVKESIVDSLGISLGAFKKDGGGYKTTTPNRILIGKPFEQEYAYEANILIGTASDDSYIDAGGYTSIGYGNKIYTETGIGFDQIMLGNDINKGNLVSSRSSLSSVAIGSRTELGPAGTVSFGGNMFNDSPNTKANYRLINVAEGINSDDAVIVSQLNTKQNTLTAGTGINIVNDVISLTQPIPAVVQSIGLSTTDVMSQKAVSECLHPIDSAGDIIPTSVVIGSNITHSASRTFPSVLIGSDIVANSSDAVIVGSTVNSQYSSSGTVSLGTGTTPTTNSVVIGKSAHTDGSTTEQTAIGYNSGSSGLGAVAIGARTSSSEGGVAIGRQASAGNYTVSIGIGASSSGNNQGIAIGRSAVGNGGIAIGGPDSGGGVSASTGAVAIGTGASATTQSIAIGGAAKCEDLDTIAIGRNADAVNVYSIAIGTNAVAQKGIAIGSSSKSKELGDVAIFGDLSNAGGQGNVAIGSGSSVSTGSYSVAIGRDSVADRNYEFSVGRQGYTRVVSNVKAGSRQTDATNLTQGNKLMNIAPTTASEGVLGQLWTDTTAMHTYQCTAIDTTDPDNPIYTWTQRW